MLNLSRAVFVLTLLLFVFPAQASSPFDIVINEVAWMGSGSSPNDEWIELYNNSNSPANLEGWVLKTADGTPEINLEKILPPKDFYLLERSDDDSAPNVSADQIYTGALNNSGENLGLYDGLGNLIDSLDCSSGWLAGDNLTKQTMERINPLSGSNLNNWANSKNPGGTPKNKNSTLGEASLQPTASPIPTPPPTSATPPLFQDRPETKEIKILYPAGIVINEILPSPAGLDSQEEWIEVFNQNNFEVNLEGWQIIDAVGKTETYTFPKETIIRPREFLVLPRLVTKITLNNDGDGLNLLRPDGSIADSANYEKALLSQSYSRAVAKSKSASCSFPPSSRKRDSVVEEEDLSSSPSLTDSGWLWSKTITPGSENIIPSSPAEAEESVFKEKPEEEIKQEGKLATIGEQAPKEFSKFLPVPLAALAIAALSGTVILALKKRLKGNYPNYNE